MICCNKVTNYLGQKQKKTKEISFKSKYFILQSKIIHPISGMSPEQSPAKPLIPDASFHPNLPHSFEENQPILNIHFYANPLSESHQAPLG